MEVYTSYRTTQVHEPISICYLIKKGKIVNRLDNFREKQLDIDPIRFWIIINEITAEAAALTKKLDKIRTKQVYMFNFQGYHDGCSTPKFTVNGFSSVQFVAYFKQRKLHLICSIYEGEVFYLENFFYMQEIEAFFLNLPQTRLKLIYA